jgi:hypothetical protein
MAADVDEGAQHAVVAASDEQRHAEHIGAEPLAGGAGP